MHSSSPKTLPLLGSMFCCACCPLWNPLWAGAGASVRGAGAKIAANKTHMVLIGCSWDPDRVLISNRDSKGTGSVLIVCK